MKVNLDDVISAIESNSNEYTYVYVIKEERIIPLESSKVDFWPYDDNEIITLPDRNDIDDYGNMERFIQRVQDETIKEWLSNAIKGRGAFRMFRATLERFHMLNDWYDYRDRCHRVCAMDWCEENGIEYEGARYEIEDDYDDYDDEYDEAEEWQPAPKPAAVKETVKPEYKIISIGRKNVNQLVFLASDFIDERLEKAGYKKAEDPDEASAKLEALLASGANIHALSDHGRYVGYCIGEEEEDRFTLAEIYVRALLRRKGLGRMLLKQLETDAEEAGKDLSLDIDPLDRDTIAFLRKCGYTALSRITLKKDEQGAEGASVELDGQIFHVK